MADTRPLADAHIKATTTQYGVTKFAEDNEATEGKATQSNDPRLSNGRTPTGAAGGVLGGNYPNPDFAEPMATSAQLTVVGGVANDAADAAAVAQADADTALTNAATAISAAATAQGSADSALSAASAAGAAASDASAEATAATADATAAQATADGVVDDLAAHIIVVADTGVAGHVTLDTIQAMVDTGASTPNYIELPLQLDIPSTPDNGFVRIYQAVGGETRVIDELGVSDIFAKVGESIDADRVETGVFDPNRLGFDPSIDTVLRGDSTWGQVTDVMMENTPAHESDFSTHVGTMAGAGAGHMSAAQATKLAGIETGATANSSDAALLARANHTGTQPASTISDFNTVSDGRIDTKIATHLAVVPGATNGHMTAAQSTKLADVATGATANDTDANLKARGNHTGTQTASTISDFNTAADARTALLLNSDGVPIGLHQAIGGWISIGVPTAADIGPIYTVLQKMTAQRVIGCATTLATGSAVQFDILHKRGAGAWTTIFTSTKPSFGTGSLIPISQPMNITSLNVDDLIMFVWLGTPAGLSGVTVQLDAVTRV